MDGSPVKIGPSAANLAETAGLLQFEDAVTKSCRPPEAAAFGTSISIIVVCRAMASLGLIRTNLNGSHQCLLSFRALFLDLLEALSLRILAGILGTLKQV